MRWLWLLTGALILGSTVSQVRAQDQVVLKGRITCAKCELGESKRCATVVVVPEGGQQVVYYFDADSHRKYHADTCGGNGRNGSVTGKIAMKDGKRYVFVSKVQYQP